MGSCKGSDISMIQVDQVEKLSTHGRICMNQLFQFNIYICLEKAVSGDLNYERPKNPDVSQSEIWTKASGQ